MKNLRLLALLVTVLAALPGCSIGKRSHQDRAYARYLKKAQVEGDRRRAEYKARVRQMPEGTPSVSEPTTTTSVEP